MAARHARDNVTRARAHTTGIVNASGMRNIRYKAFKWTEGEDISKRKRKWAKVNTHIRRHGRMQKKWGQVIAIEFM
ncbi:hypothetical protein N7537_005241 [Penicillium hordei]|uniref:Uncharacterized protein n=1 Tax=Penicillium hordei TaxID=40994 RepID=A0AAD6H7V3_9EURO|nr:uncharacterized protein N7537_005241 [Penicillium hordei]KAJ5608622.1 hypothetical protein N7537_005241 [Penicillium hordei]